MTLEEVKERLDEVMDDSKLQLDEDIVIIRKKIDKGGDYSEDNLLLHDKYGNLRNIADADLRDLLPQINEVSDIIVVKNYNNIDKRILENLSREIPGVKSNFVRCTNLT